MSKRNVIEKAADQASQWLDAVERELGVPRLSSLAALRAALHVLRDSLGKLDAVDVGNTLPVLIRGLYYESWTPSRAAKNSALARAARDLRIHAELTKTDQVVRACFRGFARCFGPEQVARVSQMLSKSVRPLWPAPPPAPAPRHLQDWHWG